MSTPQLLAETDAKMIQELNTLGYFKYIFLTVFGKGFGDRIKCIPPGCSNTKLGNFSF